MVNQLLKPLGLLVLVAIAMRVAWEMVQPVLVPLSVLVLVLAILTVVLRGRVS